MVGVLFVIAFVETLFPPFPGDVLFVAAGGWAAIGSHPFWVVAVSGFAGCLVASLILHRMGENLGRKALDGGLRWLGRADDIQKAERLFARWGTPVLAASRFIPGVRSLLVLLAGASRMPLLRAVPAVGVSALVWYLVLALLGSAVGSNWQLAERFLSRYEHVVWIVLGLLAIMILAYSLSRRRREGGTGQ